MKILYQCETCKGTNELRTWIFTCIECGKEICEGCMFGWATCHRCAKGKILEFLKQRFNDDACINGPFDYQLGQ